MRSKLLNFFICLFIILNLAILLTGNAIVYRVLFYNLASIDDYKIFPNRRIHHGNSPQPWQYSTARHQNKLSPACAQLMLDIETVSLLVIKNDQVVYEDYYKGYGPASYVNSFSMAKSYVSALIGVALGEKLITTIDQPVVDFLPEFAKGDKAKITIRHLLTMSSGLNWIESYVNPFSTVSKTYYGANLKKTIASLDVVDLPGTVFKYKGGDTQVLAFILQKITGKHLSELLETKLWFPLGSTGDALWSLDEDNGDEKASCCLNTNARDFARLGKLYLNQGSWAGHQIIPASYVAASTTANGLADKSGQNLDYYGYQWWIIPDYKGNKIFYARGVGGQYIIVVPKHDLIIVRLGKKRGKPVGKHFEEIFALIDEGTRFK